MIGESPRPMKEKKMEKEEAGEAQELVLQVVVGMLRPQVGRVDHLKVFHLISQRKTAVIHIMFEYLDNFSYDYI